MDKKEFCCIDLDFKDPEGKYRHIQLNGRWIIEDEPHSDGVLISVAITEKNQFFIFHKDDPASFYEVFASWEELIANEYYDESIIDLIWDEIKDSMLEVLDI